MMKKFILLLPFVFSVCFAHAQIADELDLLLSIPEISYAMAARFVLSAADILPEDAREVDAFREADQRGWVPVKAEPSTHITLGGLSLLLMEAFDIKGGLMYTIIPSRRYAYREMLYKQCIQGRTDPSQTVSGERFINILGRVLTYVGEEV
ncbi:hypothetical protein [Breznakiella homolactica]|uniref:Uncharacterized protein n=1 Tax=Breznakiella homolactica TaxID=2798577 RepID=A0A7T7XKB2_9SPIR|nr:hypothetical protein [Breznakiella homolactica]QQO07995.1 hypothetical protein JFL75_13715 [Breznakiella homolactica]